MYSADLAIGASGASAWERCSLGLPTVSLVMADNQSIVATELATRGCAINLGNHGTTSPEDIARAVSRLASTRSILSEMSASCYSLMQDHVEVGEVILNLEQSSWSRDTRSRDY
jgi:UDP-2,4-diacetamido-2,4,6-trideoxy-beta-L-altropyranose hydrolase